MTNKPTNPKYKRRASIQIIKELLWYLYHHKNAKYTWLLNESHMNSKSFAPHFKDLLDKKYIEYDGNFLKLTKEGVKYLSALNKLDELDHSGNFISIPLDKLSANMM